MAGLKNKFLPDEKNRRLFPAFVAWLVGLFGAACVFAGIKLSLPILGKVGFWLGAGGVLFFLGLVLRHLLFGYPRRLGKEHPQRPESFKRNGP
jgi:hypothetical protein